MEQGRVERRRGRRVNVEAPLLIRRAGARKPEEVQKEVTQNISMAGVYFETERAGDYTLNDTVISSVAIPESKRREFPFTRVAGRSRVVRINELPQPAATGRKRIGVALEFGDDVTALTATPTWG